MPYQLKTSKSNKMQLKLQDILNASEALKQIAGKELPSKLGYQLSRLQFKIQEPLKAFDTSRNELIKKYGVEQEDKTIKVSDENMPKFYEELNGIVQTEEVLEFNPININLFEGNFSKEFFILMDKFITE